MAVAMEMLTDRRSMAGTTSSSVVGPDVRSVALVTPAWPPGSQPNGIVTYTANIRSALRESGIRVFVLVLDDKLGQPDQDVIPVGPFGPAGRSYRTSIARRLWPERYYREHIAAAIVHRLRELKSRHGLQLVQMEESFGWAARVAQAGVVPTIVRLHGPWFLNGAVNAEPQDRAFHRRVEAELIGIRHADGVSAPSADVVERTREYYGIPLTGAAVIPNPTMPVPAAERWSIEHADREMILFVGRFDLHKGGDVMIDAMRRVLADRPTARLTFVGPDTGLRTGDGNVRHLQEYMAAALPDPALRDRIILKGFQRNDQIRELRRQALVTVVCSRYETFGNTVVEAMAMGCPLIATRVGGIAEIISDNETALAIEPGDADGLAKQILRLLADPNLAATLGNRAFATCSSQHSPQRIAKMTTDFYARILANTERVVMGAREVSGHRLGEGRIA